MYQEKGNRLEYSTYHPFDQKEGNKPSVMKHLKLNGILLPSQHGFQPGKSAETYLLKNYDVITDQIDQGLPVNVLLFDLAKALDEVPHPHLNKKLISCGINADLVGWILAFY